MGFKVIPSFGVAINLFVVVKMLNEGFHFLFKIGVIKDLGIHCPSPLTQLWPVPPFYFYLYDIMITKSGWDDLII